MDEMSCPRIGAIRRILALALALSVVLPTSASAGPRLRWTRSAGRELRDVAVAGSGTYVVGVGRAKGDGETLLVQRYGGAGRLIWTRRWRPSPRAAQVAPTAGGHGIAVGSDGAIYVGGRATYGCRGDQGTWFLRKYGRQGRLLWHHTGPIQVRCGWTPGTAIDDVAVRGTTVAAAVNECGGDYCDGRIEVFGTRGAHERTIPFEPMGPPAAGQDRVRGIDIGPGGRIYAAGSTAMGTGFDPLPDFEIAVVAARHDGTIVWSRLSRDRGAKDFDAATSVSVRGRLVAIAGAEQRTGCRRAQPCPVVIGLSTAGRWRWRWRGDVRVAWSAGSVDIVPGPKLLAGWTREPAHSTDRRCLLLRVRPDGARAWSAAAGHGSMNALAASRHRISVVGYDADGGVLRRFGY
ncbi:MAG: hypothetical protein ACM3OO_14180 [Planctomycetaceae bacterium]